MRILHFFLCLSLTIGLCFTGCTSNNKKVIYHDDQQFILDSLAIDFQENLKITDKVPILTKASENIQIEGLVSDLYHLELYTPISAKSLATFHLEDPKLLETSGNECLTVGIGIEVENAKEITILFRHIVASIENYDVFAQFVPSDYQESTILGASKSSETLTSPVFTSLYIGLFRKITEGGPSNSCKVFFPAQAENEQDHTTTVEERESFVREVESILQNYINKGYQFNQEPLRPFHIYFQNLGSKGYYIEGDTSNSSSTSIFNSVHQGCIYLSSSFLHNGSVSNDVQPTLAHEMFHLVQSSYAPISRRSRWLDEATASYYEWDVNRNIPASTTEQWKHLLDGIMPRKNDSMNGYARMPLIEYCVNQQTEICIVNAYQEGSLNGNWESAIYSLFPNSPQNWVTDFYTQYFLGRIASSYSPMHLYTEIVAGNESFSSVGSLMQLNIPAQNEASTSLSIPPWGARCLAITIDNKDLNRKRSEWDLQIEIQGNVSVGAIVLQENKSTIHQNIQIVTINNLSKVIEEDAKLLVFLVGLENSLQENCTCTVTLLPSH